MVTSETRDRQSDDRAASQGGEAPALCLVGDCPHQIWHRPPSERLIKAFAKQGVTEVIPIEVAESQTGPVVAVRADCVLDTPVVAALVAHPGLILSGGDQGEDGPLAAHAPAGEATSFLGYLQDGQSKGPPPGSRVTTTKDLDISYWKSLRKREVPYAIRIKPDEIGQTEWRMFMGTYKGATDLITKWLWPRPAFHATKLCARLGVTPNMVTWIGFICMVLAFWGFWQGQWALGLAAGWLMTFLDTVDGKLARITLNTSKFGHTLDHGTDLIHPPFWYIAWAVGLQGSDFALTETTLHVALAVVLAGYLLQRLLEGISILLFKIEIHTWRPIDTIFRQITARRNPNLLILTAFTIFGRPDWGFIAVAYWTAICLCLHAFQIIQAMQTARRTGGLVSWMSEATPK